MKNKINVEWLTKSFSMYSALNNNSDFKGLRGGRLYEIQAFNQLKKYFEVTINKEFIKNNEGVKSYILRKQTSYIKGDVCIIDPFVLQFGKYKKQKKNICMVHHINLDYYDNFFKKILFRNFINNLKKIDLVVVVSKF